MFHIWPGKNSVMITEFVEYPRVKVMNLLFCGGDYKELEAMLPSFEQFAKHFGCKRIYGGGRKGWLRKIKHLGFAQEYLVRKELSVKEKAQLQQQLIRNKWLSIKTFMVRLKV